jgi:hypothetical protein
MVRGVAGSVGRVLSCVTVAVAVTVRVAVGRGCIRGM